MYPQSVPTLISKNVGNTLANYSAWNDILYNVKRYGAKGDFNVTTKTGTDDTEAVVAAIAAATANGGGTIFFPPGVYRMAQPATIISGSHISFDAPDATIYLHYTQNQELFHVTGSYIKFEGLTFRSDPSYARRSSGGFIYLNGASFVMVKDNFIHDCPMANIYLDNDANNVIVSGNMIHDSKADGIHMTNGAHDVIVEGNKLYNTGDDSISVVWYAGDTHAAPKNIVIDGNLTRGSKAGGIVVAHGVNVSITSNEIVDTASSGIQVYDGGGRTDFNQDISIVGNTLKNIGNSLTDYGIYLQLVQDVFIQGNNIDTVQDSGIFIGQFVDLKIKDNIIKSNKNYGITNVTGANLASTNILHIENNTFDSSEKTSILINPPTGNVFANVFISDNKFFNNDTSNTSSYYIDVDHCNILRVFGNHNYDNTDTINIGANNINAQVGENYPQAWQTYTPTITASTGAITTASAIGYYERKGNTVHFHITCSITTNGTGAGNITFSLPITPLAGRNATSVGREDTLTGKGLVGIIKSGALSVTFYDNTYPGANGAVLKMSGSYEIA